MSSEDDAWDAGYEAGKKDVRAEVVTDLGALIGLCIERWPGASRDFVALVSQMRDGYRESL